MSVNRLFFNILFYFILFFAYQNYFSQIKINEASNANANTIIIGENTPDWIELYNSSSSNISLKNYFLSDSKNNLNKWKFPDIILNPQSFYVVLASGKTENSTSNINHYETAIFADNFWSYIVPSNNIANWFQLSFDDSNWSSGAGGFGFGDNDDQTVLPDGTVTAYIRKSFTISDTSKIENIILDIDFDDGFVAYLNGQEIARSGLLGSPPNWDELSSDHEATIYQGMSITRYEINPNNIILNQGENILAIEVHNTSNTSSDLSLIPFLSFGFIDDDIYYNGNVHPYFQGNSSNAIETNFKIDALGETIYLSDSSLTILDSLQVPDLEADMSFGRKIDGDTSQVYFTISTPNSSNPSLSFLGFEKEPIISVEGGLKYGSFSVEIINQSSSGGQIYYTLDGQNPTQNSILYSQSITVSSTSILKAKCFPNSSDLLPSKTSSEFYLFNQNHVLPVLSLTVDNQDLYGANGIFDNYWTDWKRKCHIEYFDENGQKQFESFASVKSDGGAGGSRSNPQHSVTIEPSNGSFGAGKPIEYPLIPEKSEINKYYAFYLRNGSNFWNQYPQRDATFMRMMRKTHTNSQAYRPVVVYLNGDYFGFYEIREKANEYYFQENYGNDPDLLDLLSVSYFYAPSIIRTVKGSDSSFYSMRDYIINTDKNDNQFFQKTHQKLDLYNFMDYLIGENWFANYDWIYNNMKMARTRNTDNRWKFFLQDMELGLGSWGNAYSNLFDYLLNDNLPNPFNEIYTNLIQNNLFKKKFINRYADLMNTVFTYKQYYPIVESMYQEILPEMPQHFQLWTGDVNGGMQTYLNNRNILLEQFQLRNPIVREQIVQQFSLTKPVDVRLEVEPIDAGYIKISTIVPDSLPWNGYYFDGNPVEISAIANPGFQFDHWENNSVIPFEQLNNPYLDLNVSQNSIFKAVFEGQSIDPTIIISEINYHPDSSLNGGNWIEIYNYGNTDIQLDSWKLKSKKFYETYEIPLTTTIKPKEFLVICEDTTKFKEIYPNIDNFIGSIEFAWDNDIDTVFLTNPENNIVTFSPYTDSLPYPECADGWGRTLERDDLENPILNEVKWKCSCIGGTPGVGPQICEDDLIITEINSYNISSPYNSGDWIEIKNNSSNAINLTNYQFRDKRDKHIFVFPNIELNPNSYLVLSNDYNSFAQINPKVENVISTFNFNLDSEKEILRIYDSSKKLIQSIIYNSITPWPNKFSTNNYTLEYNETLNLNPNLSEAWFDGCFLGSSGRTFSPCVVLPEGENIHLYPNPTFDEFLIVYNNDFFNFNEVTIEISDFSGRVVMNNKSQSDLEKANIKMNVSDLSCGTYLLHFSGNNEKIIKKFIKL